MWHILRVRLGVYLREKAKDKQIPVEIVIDIINFYFDILNSQTTIDQVLEI